MTHILLVNEAEAPQGRVSRAPRFIRVSDHHEYFVLLASDRTNPEDRAASLEHGDDLVVVVADGAGGLRGGAAASNAVIAAVASALGSDGFDITDRSSWGKLLTEVDHELAKTMAGETTAVIVVIGPGGIIGVSAGDSEAWVIGATGIDELTSGQNKKRLGSGHASPVVFSRPRLEGTLVVGSDGLWNYISMQRVAEVVRGRAPGDAAEGLRAVVQLRSGSYADDVGIIVVTSTR